MKDQDLVPEEDLALIVAFLDGDLEPEEAHDFKLRLLREPALSGALLEYESTATWVAEGLQHEPASSTVREVPRRSKCPRPLILISALLATAATIALAIVFWPETEDPSSPLRLEMVVLVNAYTADDYNDELNLPATQERGRSRSKKTLSPDYWSEEQYLEEAISAQRKVCEVWFAEETTSADTEPGAAIRSVTAGYVTIPFRLTEEAFVTVFLVKPTGEVISWYPSEEHPTAGDRADGSFSPDEIHYLPQPPVRLETARSGERLVEHDRGFLVPMGVGRAQVLLAGRRTSLGESFEAELATFQAELPELLPAGEGTPERLESTARELRRWLEERGFGVRAFQVVEP